MAFRVWGLSKTWKSQTHNPTQSYVKPPVNAKTLKPQTETINIGALMIRIKIWEFPKIGDPNIVP